MIDSTGTATFASHARALTAQAPPDTKQWNEIAKRAPVKGTAQQFGRPFRGMTTVVVPRLSRTSQNHAPRAVSHESVWLGRSARRGIRPLQSIIQVRISDQDGDGVFVASDSFSSVYGEGDDLKTAVRDYVESLFDHFDALDRDEATLGPALQRELAELRRWLSRSG